MTQWVENDVHVLTTIATDEDTGEEGWREIVMQGGNYISEYEVNQIYSQLEHFEELTFAFKCL